MKALIRNVVLLVLPAIAIVMEYPPTTYFRYFDFPFPVTFASYVIVYVLALGVSMIAAPLVARRLSGTPGGRALIQGIIGVVGFAVFAAACAMTDFNPPNTRIYGIFFSEWKFTNFFFYVGLPVALLSAMTAFLGDEKPSNHGTQRLFT